jgi:tetratricopeptide (TPR) repeat protein
VLEEAASAVGTLGDIYGLPGAGSLENSTEAINCYREQTALSERALKMFPSDMRARRALAVSIYKIANMVIDKDPNAAVAGYRQAMAVITGLPQTAPTLRLLNGVEGHLVHAYTALGKTAEALAQMEAANNRAAQMAAGDPQDDRAKFDLATSDVTLAHTLAAAGKRREARQSLLRSLHILEAMIKRDPENKVIEDHRQDVKDDLAKLDKKAAR